MVVMTMDYTVVMTMDGDGSDDWMMDWMIA